MKIVTICGNGLGTSLLLKMTVEKALKEIGITNGNVTHADLGSGMNKECDFFVITTDMEERFRNQNKTFVSVKNVANVEEMKEKLKGMI